jgi:alanine racemase
MSLRTRPENSAAPRAEARIDLQAIRSNVARLRAAAPSAQVMAVVKADAYGHGLIESARASVEGGATWLGTAFLEEALSLREAGIQERILCWLAVPGEPLAKAVSADVDLSASAPWMVQEIVRASEEAGRPARVHLKIDTGLSRAGATPQDWRDLVDAALKAQASGHVVAAGAWSHFVHADAPGHPMTARQLEVFRDALQVAENAGWRPEVRHHANSAATLTHPEAHFDIVRPGLAVYGLSPTPQGGGPDRFGLRPAMTLTARLALVKRVPEGSGVSYGHRYITAATTTLGLVPLGYGDGIPRNATNTAEIFAAGRRRRIAGTVCMDQFVIDLGNDAAAAGDDVLLFGPGDSGEPTAQEWAELLGTISYEIITRIGARVPRTYLR